MAKNESNVLIKDCYLLPYSRQLIWDRLNDPKILAQCIRGCREVNKESETHYDAVIEAKFASYQRDFHVGLDVEDANAPADYRLVSDVSAGFLGKARGTAAVRLEELKPGQTELSYEALISASGVIGKGLPMIEGAAHRRVRDFFDRFVATLED